MINKLNYNWVRRVPLFSFRVLLLGEQPRMEEERQRSFVSWMNEIETSTPLLMEPITWQSYLSSPAVFWATQPSTHSKELFDFSVSELCEWKRKSIGCLFFHREGDIILWEFNHQQLIWHNLQTMRPTHLSLVTVISKFRNNFIDFGETDRRQR